MESDNVLSSIAFDIHPPTCSLERNTKKERIKSVIFIILKHYDLFCFVMYVVTRNFQHAARQAKAHSAGSRSAKMFQFCCASG